MPSKPATRASWHADLAENDRAAHADNAAGAAGAGNAALVQRLDALNAELRIVRSAVSLRDTMLREQTAALRERDREIASIREQATAVRNSRSHRLLARVARVLRAPQRLARR